MSVGGWELSPGPSLVMLESRWGDGNEEKEVGEEAELENNSGGARALPACFSWGVLLLMQRACGGDAAGAGTRAPTLGSSDRQ